MSDKNDDGKGAELAYGASVGTGRGTEDGDGAEDGVVGDDLEGCLRCRHGQGRGRCVL